MIELFFHCGMKVFDLMSMCIVQHSSEVMVAHLCIPSNGHRNSNGHLDQPKLSRTILAHKLKSKSSQDNPNHLDRCKNYSAFVGKERMQMTIASKQDMMFVGSECREDNMLLQQSCRRSSSRRPS